MLKTVLVLTSFVTSTAAMALPPALHAYGLDASYADELGGPDAIPNGGTIDATFYKSKPGHGLYIKGAVPAQTYSLEMRFRLDSLSSKDGYVRILDFKNRKSDDGLYSLDGVVYFYGGAQGTMTVFTAGKFADLLITRDGSSKLVTVYVGGKPQIKFTDNSNLAVFVTGADKLTTASLLQDDHASPGEDAPSALDHVRIFSSVLNSDDARALAHNRLPPNVTQQ